MMGFELGGASFTISLLGRLSELLSFCSTIYSSSPSSSSYSSS